jgi:hypothetical protein
MIRGHRIQIASLCLAILLSCLTSSTASGQEGDPTAWLYSLKKVPDVATDPELNICYSWLKIGERKSLAFVTAIPTSAVDDMWYYRLYSVAITDKGKFSAPKKMWTGAKQVLLDVSTVWLGGGGAPASQEGRGLVFISYMFGTIGEKVKVAVAEFDSTGSVTSPFFDLAQIEAPAGEVMDQCYLAAAQGEDSIGLLYCPLFYKEYGSSNFYGVTGTAAYFLEVGFDGEPKSGPLGSPSAQQVRLINGGKMQEFIPYRSYWNGKKWLVPVSIIRHAVQPDSWGDQYSKQVGSRLLVLGAEPKAGSLKLRLREIARIDNLDNNDFDGACILPISQPAGGPKAAKSNLLLAYCYLRWIPEAQQELEAYTIQYRLQTINDKEKKVGPITAIDFPQWNHQISYDPDGMLYNSVKRLSYPLQLDDGSLVVALTRSTMWLTPAHDLAYENNFGLYSIDPNDGELTVLARGDYTYPGLFFPIVVEMMRGHYFILHQAQVQTMGSPPEFPFYYTRF